MKTGHLSLEVLLEIRKTHLVAVLILPIVLRMLLNCIVSQVDILVIEVIDIELLATGADISILIKVPFELSIQRSKQSIAAEVKFAIVNQQWIVNILLDDVGFLLARI